MEYPKNEVIASVSNLKGAIVRNVRDEKLGEIEDMVLDFATGQAAYVILLVNSGLMGLENKYFIIPWEELHYDLSQEHEGAIILDIDKKELLTSFQYGNDRALNPLKTKNTKPVRKVPEVNSYRINPYHQRSSSSLTFS